MGEPLKDGGWQGHGLQLIDYGRAIDTHLFPPGATFSSEDAMASGLECPEMLQGRPWTTQIDLFAAAACIHFLLHAEYMERPVLEGSRWRPRSSLKRYWQVEL